MKVLLTDLFLSSIPKGKESYVLEKLSLFVNEFNVRKYNMSALPAGFSVREIQGNAHQLRIFKLRINKGDRILFVFNPPVMRKEFNHSIVFLDYCHHDKQVLSGKRRGVNEEHIVELTSEDETFEHAIDQQYQTFQYDPNQMITRVVSIDNLLKWTAIKDDKAIYYLNNEQYECLQTHGQPTFIFGSAGSGKTTINIHKAYLLAMYPNKTGYFTYSNYLLDDAVKHFNKIQEEYEQSFTPEQQKRVEFNHFNGFISSHLGRYDFVNVEQFRKWMIENQPHLLKKSGLTVYEIWKEIRGLIKGMIPKDWLDYVVDLDKIKLKDYVVDGLIQKRFATRHQNQLVLDHQRIYEAKKHFLDEVALTAISLLHQHIDTYLIHNRLISEDVYFRLDKHYCSFDRQTREVIYDIAVRYEAWLKDQGRVDENDLCRTFLREIFAENVSKYDFVIADEIQDLTEVQIYVLLQLVKNKNNVLFSGDFNQTIRPTYFNTGRIESILKTTNLHEAFVKYELVRNYRSSENIVNLANEVVNLRIKQLGMHKHHDYFESPVRGEHYPVMQLKSNTKNLTELLKIAIKRHYVGIVVPDDEEKAKLEQFIGEKGYLFTVEEIKGIEKEYIICYNVMSKFYSAWQALLSGQVDQVENYRYYFNLLYVSITRARHYLCFVEDDLPLQLQQELIAHFKQIEVFGEEKLQLTETSSDNQFYVSASLYEERELYEQAIAAYKQSGLKEAKKDIRRCQALIKGKAGQYLEAGMALMDIKEYESAASYFKKANESLLYLKALIYMNLTYEEVESEFNKMGLNVLEFVYLQPKKITWLRKFNKWYGAHVKKQMNVMDDMEEMMNQLINKSEN
ncbi:MAG TPA: hypothetical protein DCY20_08060 [Firmicutes bacterium]|nr:hypothetical protein [Bacillota bacterium]